MIPNITRGCDPAGLQKYLVEHRDHEVLDLAGVSSIESAADEMESIAAQNQRVRASVFHVSLSAAIEDGVISPERWIAAALEVEREFGLTGHQRVIVRHSDKAYDHVHIFWCTVSPKTFRTPTKPPFLAPGKLRQQRGAYRLSDDDVAGMPKDAVVYRSFDSFALYRLQDLCRRLENEWALRRVRDHHEMAAARASGEARVPDRKAEQREERTGTPSLLRRADQLREALDAPDWPETLARLKELQVGLKPAFRKSKEGRGKLIGLVLYDLHDKGCRIKASDLDTPEKRYGLLQIEKRHVEDAARMEEWWDESLLTEPSLLAPSKRPDTPYDRCREAFELARAAIKAENEERRRRRHTLKMRQTAEVRRLRAEVMKRRRAGALRLPQSQRRAYYRWITVNLRPSVFRRLAEEHRHEHDQLRPLRVPQWQSFIKQQALNGNTDARLVRATLSQAPGRRVEQSGRVQHSQLVRPPARKGWSAGNGTSPPPNRQAPVEPDTMADRSAPALEPPPDGFSDLQLVGFLEEMRGQRGH